MKFVVVGAGSIGKRHIRNLISLGIAVDDVLAVDPREDRLSEVNQYGVRQTYSNLSDALGSGAKIDAAIICSPTSLHITQGIELAKRGIHICVEKPLAHNLDGLNEFKDIVNSNDVCVLMAYIFRFSPLTNKIREILASGAIGKPLFVRGEFSEFLPDWHPYEDYRSFYMAEKSLGGGSILDQSHIFDLVHFLFGGFKRVFALNGNLSNLEVKSDDFSQLEVVMENGLLASLHTDMFGRDHKKELEIKGEYGNIYWSSTENLVIHYDATSRSKTVYNKFPVDFNLNYITELKHFIACCEGAESPLATLDDGVETMKLILAAEKSVQTGMMENV